MRARLLPAFALLLLAPTHASAAPDASTASAAAGETSAVKPAAERTLSGGTATSRPVGTGRAGSGSSGAGSIPITRGPKIPEALRQQMKATLDKRIDSDLTRIKALRVEALGLLNTFVSESPRESPEMPEAMMRLGELKWEDEREGFLTRFADWEKKPVDLRGPTPEPNYQASRDLFGRVLKDYPWYKEYDLTLYVDGFLATLQGKTDDAAARFERILKEYPNSRFVPDAHMAKAEHLFNEKYDYTAALAEYEEVLKFRQSDLYGLALFKSAWCEWRLGNTDEAAQRFVKVFELNGTNATQRKQLDELQSEALKYLVEVFTEDEKNTANDVYGFLTKVGGDKFAGKVVKALAETFYDQAHYERGIEAYELLLRLDPTNRDAGNWVLQIAAGWSTLEDYPKLKATYDRALTGYTVGGPWARTQADQENVKATQAKIAASLRQDSINLHGKAMKDKSSRAEFEGAAALYDVYLSKFSGEPKSYEIQFNEAEIDFYHLDKNTEAATHYMIAAKTIPNDQAQSGPLKTMRHDAIYNAIAALERVRVNELEARKGKPGGGAETESDKKFAEALDLYAALYPNDPSLPELFFRQGKLYYDYGVYDPAVRIWGALLEKFPRSPYAQGAGELILDSFNKSKNYENIEKWAKRLKSAPAFQTRELQAKLDVLIVQSVFKQGEQKGAAGDHAGAAAAYLSAAKEFPNEPRAAQACVNAELEAQKAGDITTLKEAATLVTGAGYRDKPESPAGAWTAAASLQSMGLYDEAADFDEAIATNASKAYPHYQKFEHAKDASYNSVVLREATGEHDRAIANGNRFLASYGSSAEADEVAFTMGRAHQNAGRNREAIELYKRYLSHAKNQDKRAEGFVLLAQAQLKSNDEKGADASLKSAVLIGKQRKSSLGADGKYAAAHARYMEGERVLDKFDKIQIQGSVKELTARLKQKTALLKDAATVFLDVVSLGVAEWTTAALYQIGHTYELFAKSLRDSPAPTGLSESDQDAYKAQIEEFTVPIEEKSLDAYENGWKKAVELGIYNQWTAKMRESLGRLNAELYPPFHETGFEVRTVSPAALPALLEAPRRGPQAEAPPPAAATAATPATTPPADTKDAKDKKTPPKKSKK